MAATRCAVFVFKRVYCVASTRDRVTGVVAEWFSLHERLIFQTVSKNISWRRSSSAKCGVLSMPTVGPCLAVNSIATRYKEPRSPSLKADVHKILLLLVLVPSTGTCSCASEGLLESDSGLWNAPEQLFGSGCEWHREFRLGTAQVGTGHSSLHHFHGSWRSNGAVVREVALP